MKVMVYIAPHEKHEALEAYNEYLNEEQLEQIEEHEGPVTIEIDYTEKKVVKVVCE